MIRKFLAVIFIAITAITISLFVNPENHEKEEAGPDMYPAEWAWNQRTFPHFKAEPLAQYNSLLQAQEMIKAKANRLNKLSDISWEFAGPVNIAGRIVDLEFNLQNPNTVYASASTGGVFKSYNMGNDWIPIFDDQAVMPMGDLAVDPLDSNIVYAGTGEPNGSHNNFPGAGVFKSTDGGMSWTNIGLIETAQIGRIIIDPTNTKRVFVAAPGPNFNVGPERGVFRSTDAGTTWEKVLFVNDSTGAIDVVMAPDDPNIMHAATWQRHRRAGFGQSETSRGPGTGIYRSTDGGTTWTELGTAEGLPDGDQDYGRIGLAVTPADPDVVVALYTDGGSYAGTYKSTDKGLTWNTIDQFLQAGAATATFSWYFGQIRINPTDPDKVFVLDQQLAYTDDNGSNWDVIWQDELHVDHHAMAFHPTDPNIVLIGNDGGINKSTNGGLTWSNPVELPVTQFYEINIDLNNPERLYGGTQDNNTIRTPDGGIDTWERLLGGDGFYCSVDYTDADIIYAEYQNGNIFRSTDGGQSFDYIMNGIDGNERRNWSTPVIMDPIDPKVLYMGTSKVYKTTNRGDLWKPISPDLVANNPEYLRFGTVTTIGVSMVDNNIIYAGTDDSWVWVSKDGGANWNKIIDGLPPRWVTRVMPCPHDENVVYATFSGLKWGEPVPHVFRSSDQGTTWSNISSNLPDSPVNAIAIDYNNSNVVYVGTDVGAYVTFDLGGTWEPLGKGMPMVSVYDIKIHPDANYLVAGTFGRSMYKIDLNQVVAVNNNGVAPNDYELGQNYPNPFNPTTTISFTLPKADNVKLSVYSINGELVKELTNNNLSEGRHYVTWNGRNSAGTKVASGTYIYRLEAGNYSFSKKMMLLK